VIKPRRSSNPEPAARKTVRCAIYTRKSTEEGLDQDFNSLDAQRESAEAYIRSQSHEGWKLVPTRYDDGGFSGGNLERPALGALIGDIKAGKVDCVVVYKVDRLSRSLMDFSRLVEVFEEWACPTFVDRLIMSFAGASAKRVRTGRDGCCR
jgi:site-specific DNA recombinase